MAKRKPANKTPRIRQAVEAKEIESKDEISVSDEFPEPAVEVVEPVANDVSASAEVPVTELDDDELALLVEDEKIELTEDLGIFKQHQEGLIAWSIENFYQEDGTVRSKRELRTDPPILRIENASGEQVDFLLTKQFTRSLYESLETVNYGLFGVKKSKSRWTNFREALVGSILENPLKVIVFGLLVILTLVALLVS